MPSSKKKQLKALESIVGLNNDLTDDEHREFNEAIKRRPSQMRDHDIGVILEDLLEKSGLTIKEVSKKLHISESKVHDILIKPTDQKLSLLQNYASLFCKILRVDLSP